MMRTKWFKVVALQLLFMAVAALVAAEPALTIHETTVRQAPENTAEQVDVLPPGRQVELSGREGGWYAVTTANGKSGWLPLLSVRKVSAEKPKPAKGSGLRNLLSSFRTGSSGVTVATGVRGLDAVDLKNSKPNMEELARMNSFACNDADAKSYARQAGLVSRDISWLPAPAKRR